MDMNSEVSKWMPLESAVCFPNQSEEASQTKTEEEEEEEKERFKRPRTTLDNEDDVEEFMALLDRIEETKKLLKRKSVNFSGSSISAGGGINAVEVDRMLTAPPVMHQPQGSSDAGQSSTLPWKPSFQWEDFNICNSRSAQTDLSDAAATEKYKEAEETVQKGNGPFKTRSFLDGVTPTECSQGHVDDVNKEEEDGVEAPPGLELQLFPCQ